MAKFVYIRPKLPSEIVPWFDKRKRNIEDIRKQVGINKPMTNMDAWRIIARTDGVDLPEFIVKELKKKR